MINETEITNLNVPLLHRIQAHILEEPKRLDMENWFTKEADKHYMPYMVPACNTVGCIAGWATQLSGFSSFSLDASKVILGFDKDGDLNRELFYVGEWDFRFSEKYRDAENPEERAKVTVEYIDFFISKYGPKTSE